MKNLWDNLTYLQKLSLISLPIFVISIPLGILLLQKPTKLPSKATAPSSQDVKVLVLNYFPLDATGTKLDKSITDSNKTLEEARNWTATYTQQGIEKLTEATRYHGYKDPSSQPYLRYSVLETKEFLKPTPKNPDHNKPDYKKILTEDVNICDYVDNRGVRQVWMWSYHFGDIAPDESNMSMGTRSKSFWDTLDYVDISNSNRINDMPICQNTYTLYNYNYERALGELLEDHGHQLEVLFDWVHWWIISRYKEVYLSGKDPPTVARCGWIHSPPNTTAEYDWNNSKEVLSSCEDWKPDDPDRGGTSKLVSCHTWQGANCDGDSGVAFKVWWMQNMPGYNNGIVCRNGGTSKNWWEFYGDLDSALATHGRNLIDGNCNLFPAGAAGQTPTPTPTPTRTASPTSTPTPTPTSSSGPMSTTSLSSPTPTPTSSPTPTTTPEGTSSPTATPEANSPISQATNILNNVVDAVKNIGKTEKQSVQEAPNSTTTPQLTQIPSATRSVLEVVITLYQEVLKIFQLFLNLFKT